MNFRNLFLGLTTSTIAQDHPINYFDIGSRGGFQEDLLPLAFAVNAIGFEPEPSEFIKLNSRESSPWLTSKHLPFAISGDGGRQTLFISRGPQSASLLQHNMELGVRFDKTQFVEVEGKIEIETQTLSEALELANINSIDYLKIDIEGAELEVFRSSPTIMDNILAVKTEVSFVEFRHDQPHAFEVEEFMKEKGFMLMDLVQPAHWRRQGYVIHPYTANEVPPYSRGQIVHGDYLFFRDPETLGDEPEAHIKLALIAMALGYFDNSLMILENRVARNYVSERYGKSILEFIEPASRAYGRRVFWKTLYSQIRGLVPLIRYSRNVLRKQGSNIMPFHSNQER